MRSYTFTSPTDRAVKTLIDALSSKLKEITGDDGRSSFSADDFDEKQDKFLLVKQNGKPVACGAIRRIDVNTCEIKRMFSTEKGIGSEVLLHLENKAKETGYRKIILSTRNINKDAVNFYHKHGYLKIPAYGKYQNTDLSICMGKRLDI